MSTDDTPYTNPARSDDMQILRRPIQVIRTDLGAYLVLNVVVYGLFLAGFAAALVFPELTAARVEALQADGTADLVGWLFDKVWLFALVILGVNTLTVGVASILLPSMVVPFAGVAVFAYRAFTIGTTLAPVDENGWLILIPHSLTVVVEFQAYVLLVLGAYLLGRAWLRPATVGVATRRQGYVRGLRQAGWVAVPAFALLVFGAVYEAFSLRYLVPLLLQG
ncbi:stage II sporulation protein M [Pseudonocardia sediminis]|nr:stage II sporulation protein M [Pseudonocardia sediminis]